MCIRDRDLRINIYYQDTDSMHIEDEKISMLADEFKKRYGRELIGSDIGQFHNDFDELENAYCVLHISAGKKIYYDLLRNDKGQTAEHLRLKGIPSETIINHANKYFKGRVKNYIKHYTGVKK